MPGKFIILLVLCACGMAVCAQNESAFTLQQCIDSALRKNIDIRQAKLTAEATEVRLRQARAQQIPTVYADVDQTLNLGRNIDPYTNSYVNKTVGYGSTTFSGDMVVYNGFNIRNTIKQSELAAIASNEDLQQNTHQIRLNVTLAYLNVLNVEEQLAIVKDRATISNDQLERMELKKKKGVVAVSDVTDLKGQLLNDNLAIIDLQNTLELYKLELVQKMNIPYNKHITFAKINVDELMTVYQQNNEDIYNSALNNFAAIKVTELRAKAAEYGVKAAKGLRYPSVSAGANVSTVYTSSANILAQKVAFSNQFVNNRAANFYVSVHIPIFVKNIKNNIRLAELDWHNSQLAEEQTKVQVRQQIERAYVAMTNAYNRYKTLEGQLEAYATSFKAAQAKFETGVEGSVNYLIAKNNLDRANINYITAKYDFVLKKKTLDFYQNSTQE